MMNSRNEYITTLQYIICIHTTQTAAGMLTFPNIIAETAGTDGWISIIIGYLLTNIVGFFIIATMKKNPNMKFVNIIIQYFGQYLGTFLLFMYCIYFILAGFLALLRCVDIIIVWILPNAPAYQIALLLLIPFYILAKDSIFAICRYNELIFFMTLFLPVILIFSLRESFHPIHLLPVIKEGWGPIFKGVKDTIYPYSGLEITYILYPFLRNKEKAYSGLLIANTLSMFLLMYVTILCFINISPKGMQIIIWPVLSLLKSIHFSFLERLEILYIAYYLLIFSTTIVPYLFSATSIVAFTSKKLKSNYINIFLIFVLIAAFFFIKFNVNTLLSIYNLINEFGLIFIIIIPTLLFFYTYIFKFVTGRKV